MQYADKLYTKSLKLAHALDEPTMNINFSEGIGSSICHSLRV